MNEIKLVYDGKEYTAQVGSATGYRRDQYDKVMRQISKNRRNVNAMAHNAEMELRNQFEDVQGLLTESAEYAFMSELQKTDVIKWGKMVEFKRKYTELVEDTKNADSDVFSNVLYDCAKFVLVCNEIPRDKWLSNEFWEEQDYLALDNAICSFRDEITSGGRTNSQIADPVLHSGVAGAERAETKAGDQSEVAECS